MFVIVCFVFLFFLIRKLDFLNFKYYKDKFSFIIFGFLISSNNIFFIMEFNLYGKVIISCFNFC